MKPTRTCCLWGPVHLFPGDAPRRLYIMLLHRRVTDPDIQGHTVSCPLLQMKAGAVLALRHLASSGALVLAAAAHTLLDFAPTTGRNDSLGLVKSVFQTWVLLGQGRGEERRGAGCMGVAAMRRQWNLAQWQLHSSLPELPSLPEGGEQEVWV